MIRKKVNLAFVLAIILSLAVLFLLIKIIFLPDSPKLAPNHLAYNGGSGGGGACGPANQGEFVCHEEIPSQGGGAPGCKFSECYNDGPCPHKTFPMILHCIFWEQYHWVPGTHYGSTCADFCEVY